MDAGPISRAGGKDGGGRDAGVEIVIVGELWAAIGFGLVTASALIVAALGFNLNLAVSNVINVGFISFMMVGQFLAYAFWGLGGTPWLPVLLASCATGAVAVVVGLVVEFGFNKRSAAPFTLVIVTFAVATIAVSALSAIFGSNEYSFPVSSSLLAVVHIVGLTFTKVQLIVMGIAAVIVVFMDMFLRWSPFGRSVRAIADDMALAKSAGLPVDAVVFAVWALSGILGALSGVLLSYTVSNFTTTGDEAYFVLIVAAAFTGGAGKPLGSVVGGVIIGVVGSLVAIVSLSLSPIAAFAVLILVLLVRPTGVLGKAKQVLRA